MRGLTGDVRPCHCEGTARSNPDKAIPLDCFATLAMTADRAMTVGRAGTEGRAGDGGARRGLRRGGPLITRIGADFGGWWLCGLTGKDAGITKRAECNSCNQSPIMAQSVDRYSSPCLQWVKGRRNLAPQGGRIQDSSCPIGHRKRGRSLPQQTRCRGEYHH
jgi:hypothetical protein